MTPLPLAREVVSHYRPHGRILEPARGDGAFFTALKSICSDSTVEWCEIREGRDFFNLSADQHYDWTCTNPPWSKFRKFLQLSMGISDHVVFLATLTHFMTRARLQEIAWAGFGLREAYCVDTPGPPWPSSGFQLAAVHLERGYRGGLVFSGYSTEPLMTRGLFRAMSK